MNNEAKSRTAIIYGASGAIGGALCARLVKDGWHVFAGSRGGGGPTGPDISPFPFDLRNEGTIAASAKLLRETLPELVIVATGMLTSDDGAGPERTYKRLDPNNMADNFTLNTIGPALIAKHILPLLPRDRRSVFAALSARVGSIGDNGLGGWHSYRASKAALNMLLKNFAIELERTHGQAIIAGLHPGTVDSALSAPFQGNLPDGQLTQPEDAARHLLRVIEGLTVADSGSVFDWAGERIRP
ncbi:MAG: SDR family NAD(P)-dependent oxidoreductase [Pontixanthobacter sp.]